MAVSKALALTTLFSKARRGHLVAQAQTKFREVNFPRDNPLMGAGGGAVSLPSLWWDNAKERSTSKFPRTLPSG